MTGVGTNAPTLPVGITLVRPCRPLPLTAERIVCVIRPRGRFKHAFWMDVKIDGTFVVRVQIKKDVFDYLAEKGVEVVARRGEGEVKYDRTEPCKSCPYRRDAPRKLWAPVEFENLLRQDADPLHGSTFGCHEGRKLPLAEQRMCVGWMIHQKRNNTPSIMLRLQLRKNAALDDLYAKIDEKMPGLFRTLAAMCRANGVDPKKVQRTGAE